MNQNLATVNRRLGDPFAFALLQWPCVVLLFELPEGVWWTVLRVALALWLAATALAAFSGRGAAAARDGARFGLWMLICLCLVALAWAAHPGPWLYACLVALPFAFYAAQRAALAGFVGGLEGGQAAEDTDGADRGARSTNSDERDSSRPRRAAHADPLRGEVEGDLADPPRRRRSRGRGAADPAAAPPDAILQDQ